MSFVPKDVRTTRDFELVLGQEEMLRHSVALADPTVSVDVGEWLKLVTSAGATKADKLVNGTDVLATPALGAKVSWTKYREADTNAGQADAAGTKQVDLLSGSYQAKTKIFVTGGTYAPGFMLVAVEDAGVGKLNALDPATATVRQLQGVVARVIEVANGVLHYEAPGL